MQARRCVLSALLASMLAAGSVAATGCGSGASGTSIDPARVVPASAPLYTGAIVRPTGSLQSSARAAGQALTHQSDPYLRLVGALQTPGSGKLDYARDVAPWLGPRAGIFLTATGSSEQRAVERLATLLEHGILGSSSAGGEFPFASRSVEGAIVLDTRDASKARSFLQKLARRAGAHATSYRGVPYEVTAGGIAFAIVARLAVLGTDTGVRAVIDTNAGGPALASAPAYAKLLAAAPAGALAHVYANAGAFGGTGSAQRSVSGLSLLAGSGYVNASLVPAPRSITVDADAIASAAGANPGGLFSSGAKAATALGELPGESWLAVGLGDVGHTLGADVAAIEGLASLGGGVTESGGEAQSGGFSVKGLLAGILAPLRALGGEGATMRDFASWMGSAGLFTSGTGLLELRGGAVIDSNDASRSRAAVGELGAILRRGGASVQPTKIAGADTAVAVRVSGLPAELDVAAGTGASGRAKFVIGLGPQSVQTALKPASTISSSAAFATASATLGHSYLPDAIVDFPTLLGLFEGVGLSEDPSVAPLVPYLRSLTTLSAGSASLGGGIERERLVLGLQGGG